MANKQERDELHRAIWSIAEALRGSVSGWDFKSYVLGIMFYRYISENLVNHINQIEHDANPDKPFDFAALDDDFAAVTRDQVINIKGFYIPPSHLFCNMVKSAGQDENLNVTLEKVFREIEDSAVGAFSESGFSGLFSDLDFNSAKLGPTVKKRNENLVALLTGVANMQLGDYQDHSIDAFGDAYEYLISMYASNAGKSGGEFFTPQEVSRLLTMIALRGRTKVNKVYDPACGSGSLLLQAAKILGNGGVTGGFYGQEINLTTYNLCRINMVLHNIAFDKFQIALGDTLTDPQLHDKEPVECLVSNPPYSVKWVGNDDPTLINDPRFAPAGVLAPKGKADFAFIMHSLSWLAEDGVGAIVCFPGIMYRGGAEQKIRQYLVNNGFVDAIIQLPDNLFFGTSIATCIMVLRRGKSDNSVLFVDASKQFVKATNNNKLSEENVQFIFDTYMACQDMDHVARVVSRDEIAEHDFNLSVSTYVEPEDIREKVDIVALNREIDEIVARENVLRGQISQIIAEIEGEA